MVSEATLSEHFKRTKGADALVYINVSIARTGRVTRKEKGEGKGNVRYVDECFHPSHAEETRNAVTNIPNSGAKNANHAAAAAALDNTVDITRFPYTDLNPHFKNFVKHGKRTGVNR